MINTSSRTDPSLPARATDIGSSDALQSGHCWIAEIALVWIRWCLLPPYVLLLLLVPASLRLLVVSDSLALGFGNAGVAWLLHQSHSQRRLRQVRWLATVTEWAAGLGIVVLFSRNATSNAPAVLFVLLLVHSVRHGLRGLFGATAGVAFSIAALIATHTWIYKTINTDMAKGLLEGWESLALLMAFVLGGLTWAREEWCRREAISHEGERTALARLRYGFTEREWEVLGALADDLTYQQIGVKLNISDETVKTHVRHIGGKLGTSGRRGITKEACRQGLMALDNDRARER